MWEQKDQKFTAVLSPIVTLGSGWVTQALVSKQDKIKQKHLMKEVRIFGTADLEVTVNRMMPRMVKLWTSMDALAHQPSPRQVSLQLTESSVEGQIHDQYITGW